MKLSKAVGWKPGERPTPTEGYDVQAFAQGLDHPRWPCSAQWGYSRCRNRCTSNVVLPQQCARLGRKRIMRFTGSGYPSADRITLLRDTDQDGIADLQVPFITGLKSPFGMALIGQTLFVANTDAILAYPYANGDTSITKRGELITRLPAAAPNSHWTKNLLAHPNGEALFVAVGSNSNIGELGVEAETGRAGIWRLDLNTRELTPFAKGLRNPVGMAWHTSTDTLWTVVNERDQLGNDLVPDYLAQVNAGDDFGWPTHYWGNFEDPRVPRDWVSQITQYTKYGKAPAGPPNLQTEESNGEIEWWHQGSSQLCTRRPHCLLGPHLLCIAFYSGLAQRHNHATRLLESQPMEWLSGHCRRSLAIW